MRNTGSLRAAVICSTALLVIGIFSTPASADPESTVDSSSTVKQPTAEELPRELVDAVVRDLKISPQKTTFAESIGFE